MITSVAVVFVGGPMDGKHQVILQADEFEIHAADLKPVVPGEAAIYEGIPYQTRIGVYAWRKHTINPRKYDWQGWQYKNSGEVNR